jgi:23S rRNA (adenine2030-N6)-methyltransferase
VVVVDPPYEQTDERARITATLAAAYRKWAHGVTVIWYPLKDRATHVRWKDQLRQLGIPKFLTVEHWLYDSDQPGIYNGAGLLSSIRPMPSRRRCRPARSPARRAGA